MTSQKSLKYKHNTPYSFKTALSSGSVPTVLYAIFMLIIFPIMNLTNLLQEKARFNANEMFGSTTSPLDGGVIPFDEFAETFTSLNEKYVYSLFSGGKDTMIFILIATIAASILMGISLFRFITAKKTVNVYYSLGITRTNLFVSRFSAGLSLLFLCSVVPVVLSAIVSTVLIGASSELFTVTLFTALSIFSTAALTYSVTAAVFSAVGTSIEGAGFTAVVMLVPTVFFYCLEAFGRTMLYGTPLKLGYFQLQDGYYETVDMVYEYGLFNPLVYLFKLFDVEVGYGELRVETLHDMQEMKFDFASELNFAVPLAWLAVAAVAFILGIAVYNRRKAEICGFLGMSRTLNFIGSFILGFGAFTIIVNSLDEDSLTLSCLLGFAAMAVIYLVFNLIITRAPKRVFKSIYLLGIQMLIMGVILGIFTFGGFGYSSKIPKADEIESVQVSGVAIDTLLSGDDCYIDSFYTYDDNGDIPVFPNSLSCSAFGPYTSKEDINRALMLHTKLIELGGKDLDGEKYINSSIILYYKLKNGKTMVRYYDKADIETLRLALNFYDSDFYDEIIEKSFLGEDDRWNNGLVDYNFSKVIAAKPSLKMEHFDYLDLNEEQYTQLKTAIVKDLKNMTAKQYYYPEKPAVGVLIFAVNDWLGLEYDIEGNITKGELMDHTKLCGQLFGGERSAVGKTIFVTEDMIETISFMTKNDLMRYFGAVDVGEIEQITFRPAKIDRESWLYRSGEDITLNYFAKNYTAESKNYDGYESKYPVGNRLIDQNKITDKAKISEIVSKAQLYYFAENNGYVCYITYTNGETVEKYLPQSDAPDFVTNYDYKTDPEEMQTAVDNSPAK